MKVIRLPRFRSFFRLFELLSQIRPGEETILFIPPRRLFRYPMIWELVSLYAKKHGLVLTIISPDPQILTQATVAGCRVSSFPPGMEEAAGREVTAPRRIRPIWPVAVLFLFFLGGAFLLLLPRPTVFITPARRLLSLQAAVVVSPAYREGEATKDRLPGILLHRSGLVVYDKTTTGIQWEGATHAQGKVVFINEHPEAVTVPAGTIIQSAGGLRFRTQNPVTVPAAKYDYLLGIRVGATSGRATTTVRAEQPGSQGNLAPGKLTTVLGPLARRLKVVNPASLTGGTDRRVQVVAPADVEAARQEALRQMELKAPEEARASAGPDRVLLPNSLALTPGKITYSPNIGEKGETLRVTLPYRFQVLTLDRATLEKFLLEKARRETPAHFGVVGPLTVTELRDLPLTPTEAKLEIIATYTAVGRPDRRRLLAALRGKTVEEAHKALLDFPEVATARIEFPADRRLPRLTWLIRLVYLESTF